MNTPRDVLDAIFAGTAPEVSAQELGLSGRAVVHIDGDHCVQLIDRNARFVRKDAERFRELLAAARLHTGRELMGSVVIRSAPVCSQARAWLESQGIEVGSA
jgi:hypothetical protein